MLRVPAIAPLEPMVALALVLGVGLCLALPDLLRLPWLYAALLIIGLYAWWCGGSSRLGGLRRLLGASLAGFALAALHALWVLSGQLGQPLELQEIMVTGQVRELPRHEQKRTRFLFEVQSAQWPSSSDVSDEIQAALDKLKGRTLRLAWYDPFTRGDENPQLDTRRLGLVPGQTWQLQVRLRAPRGLRNPGGFDSERYAFANRIAAVGSVRMGIEPQQLGEGGGIDAWRQQMSGRIDAAVPSESSRYVRALALGDVNGLSEHDWNALRAIGLTHLIAISGFHVGVVAGFFALWARIIWWCLPWLGRLWPRPLAAGVTALAGASLYTALVGFELPTVRTTLMIAVVVLARCSRRHHRAVDALGLAAIAMLLVDPLSILAPGFWLSFLGVAWLLWCLPGPTQSSAGAMAWLQAQGRDLVQAQGVASLGLLPLTVVFFNQASLAGPLANLIAVPWWSLVVVPLSLLGTLCEFIWAGSGGLLWRLAAWCFDLSWPGFLWLSQSPFALWWPALAPWSAFALAMLGALWLLLPRGLPGRGLAVLLLIPLLWPQRDLPNDGAFDVVMVDVGQGSAVLVRTAKHHLLYDFGPAMPEGWDAGERAVLPVLRAFGVRQVQLGIASHDDADHAGGAQAVRNVFTNMPMLAPPGSRLDNTEECVAGSAWEWDGVRFELLHPPEFFPYFGNESSCVLRIVGAHGSALLLGDIGEVIEQRLLRLDAESLRSDVVLVGHHGSRHSSSAAFVAATGAKHALISRGYGNRFGHPDAQVVANWQAIGAQLWDTTETGALQLRLRADGIEVLPERQVRRRLWDATR